MFTNHHARCGILVYGFRGHVPNRSLHRILIPLIGKVTRTIHGGGDRKGWWENLHTSPHQRHLGCCVLLY